MRDSVTQRLQQALALVSFRDSVTQGLQQALGSSCQSRFKNVCIQLFRAFQKVALSLERFSHSEPSESESLVPWWLIRMNVGLRAFRKQVALSLKRLTHLAPSERYSLAPLRRLDAEILACGPSESSLVTCHSRHSVTQGLQQLERGSFSRKKRDSVTHGLGKVAASSKRFSTGAFQQARAWRLFDCHVNKAV